MDAAETRRRILDLLDRWDEEHETSGCPAKVGECIHSATAGIRAVVELHMPGTRLGEADRCKGCEVKGVAFVWLDRCETLGAVARALGVLRSEPVPVQPAEERSTDA